MDSAATPLGKFMARRASRSQRGRWGQSSQLGSFKAQLQQLFRSRLVALFSCTTCGSELQTTTSRHERLWHQCEVSLFTVYYQVKELGGHEEIDGVQSPAGAVGDLRMVLFAAPSKSHLNTAFWVWIDFPELSCMYIA